MSQNHSQFRWLSNKVNEDDIMLLHNTMEISKIFATILVNRGIRSKERAIQFLHPKLQDLHDPYLFNGMQTAIARIQQAIMEKQWIALYGDYDVDGMTATSLFYQCLKLFHAEVCYYIPDRLKEGYGIHPRVIRELHQKGVKLIITLDCGISAHEAVTVAKELGIDVIITDHHEIGQTVPEALAVIDPKYQLNNYPFPGITAVGVAFKLAWALCKSFSPGSDKKVKPEFREFLLESMALVALGTIADVAPLYDENRIMVKYGLQKLSESKNPGICALKEVANLRDIHPLTPEHVGFWLGPRLNAMGRLNHANSCVEMLLTQDYKHALSLAERLDQENKRRKTIQEGIYNQAQELIKNEGLTKNKVLILAHHDWHPGVIGIVASTLLENYYRPVFMISLENSIGKGSARSIPGFHLFEALQACGNCLLQYGGHERAGGFKIAQDKIPLFQEAMNKQADVVLQPEQMLPSLVMDAVIKLEEIDWKLFAEIQQMAPFGERNPEPLLVSHHLDIVKTPPPTRCGNKGEHIRFMAKQGSSKWRVIGFGKGDWWEKLINAKRCALAFTLNKNTWGNSQFLELEVKDICLED